MNKVIYLFAIVLASNLVTNCETQELDDSTIENQSVDRERIRRPGTQGFYSSSDEMYASNNED